MNHDRSRHPPPMPHHRDHRDHRDHQENGGGHHQRGGSHQHHRGAPPPHQRPQPHHPPPGGGPPPTYHSYKVLIDPMIHKGAEKQVRYDGSVVPGNPHHVSPSCTDPRKKPIPSQVQYFFVKICLQHLLQWRLRDELELPVPRMVIDEFYIGEPPKLEVYS